MSFAHLAFVLRSLRHPDHLTLILSWQQVVGYLTTTRMSPRATEETVTLKRSWLMLKMLSPRLTAGWWRLRRKPTLRLWRRKYPLYFSVPHPTVQALGQTWSCHLSQLAWGQGAGYGGGGPGWLWHWCCGLLGIQSSLIQAFKKQKLFFFYTLYQTYITFN